MIRRGFRSGSSFERGVREERSGTGLSLIPGLSRHRMVGRGRLRRARATAVVTAATLVTSLLAAVTAPDQAFASTIGPNPTSGQALSITSTTDVLSSFAGSSTQGGANGYGPNAQFYYPRADVALNGYVYVEDGVGSMFIRKVNVSTGQVTTLTGGQGYCNDSTTPSQVGLFQSLTLSTDGTYLYTFENCDPNNGMYWVRQIDPNTGATTTLAKISDSQTGSGYPELTTGPDNALYVTSGYKVLRVDGVTHQVTTYYDLTSFTYNGYQLNGLFAIGSDSSGLYVGVYLYNPSIPGSEGGLLKISGGSNPTVSVVSTSTSWSFGGGSINDIVTAGPYIYFEQARYLFQVTESTGAWNEVINSQFSQFVPGAGSTASVASVTGLSSDGSSLWLVDGGGYDYRLGRLTAGVVGAAISAADWRAADNRSKPCACTGVHQVTQHGQPVDDQFGTFWHSFTDVAIPGRGLSLNLSRSYNSDSTSLSSSGLFGPGWSWSYGMSLSVSGSTVTVLQESGSQVVFNQSGLSYVPAQANTEAILVHNGDGTWTLTRHATQTLTFNSSGQLTAEKDLNGYTTAVTYPSGSQIVATDPAGRTLTATISGGHISSVSDGAGRSVSYGYNDAFGDLTDVVDVNSGHSQFVYNSSHQLLVMVSPRYYTGTAPIPPTNCTSTPPANVVSNVYDGSGRVICQWDQDGRQTTFDYTSIAGATKVTDPKGNITVDYFTNGLLTSETKAYGTSQAATWKFMYDPNSGGITETVDPNGHITYNYYDSFGNRTTAIDPLGRTTTSTYNSYNRITSVTPPATYGGQTVTTTYTYDEPAYSNSGVGNLTTASTPILSSTGSNQGTQVTHYGYGDSAHPGDVTSMIDPGANTWSYTYDSYGDKTSQTAPATSDNSDGIGSRSNVTKWVYNTATGWITQQLAPRFVLANPSATTCTTPAVGCSTFTYDNVGRVLTATDGDGHVSTNHYDADGNRDYSIDADSNRTNYTLDAAGQLTVTTRPDTTTVKTNYWPDGTVEDQIDASNADTHYVYDPLGHLTSVTDPDNRTTGYTYDAVGSLLVRSDPGVTGCTTSSTAKGCTIHSYDVANESTGINYNDPGVTPNVTAVAYDGNGRRISMTEQVHGSTTSTVTSSWAYDSLGRTTSAADINNQIVGYGYDSRGGLTSITYPGSTGTVNRTFDAAGRVRSIADWLGNTTTYAYDADSNLGTQTSPTTGTSVVDTSGFDNADNLTSIGATQGSTTIDNFSYVVDPNAQETSVTSTGVPQDNHSYSYNSLNQLNQVDNAPGYGYDHADNPTGLTGGATQSFDAANQLTASTPAISLISTALGGDSGTGNSVTLSLTGVQANDQILVASTQASGASVTGPSGYTSLGSFGTGSAVTTMWRKTAGGTETSAQLGYTLGQPKSVTAVVYRGVDPNTPIDASSTISADTSTSVTIPSLTASKVGERLLAVLGATTNVTPTTWTAPSGMTSEVTKSDQALSSETIADQTLYTAGATGSRAATFGTVPANLVGTLIALKPATSTYGYDTRGDFTSVTTPLGTTNLGYDQARRLSSYGANATYTYNGDGLRMTKAVSSTTSNYTYDQADHIVVDGTTNYIYGADGLPLEQISGATLNWFHHDRIGSTRAITNASGIVVGTFTYNPYGTLTGSTGTASTPIGFASGYKDAESGLTYLLNRYYNPSTALFLNRDPLDGLTRSAYGYTSDNPLNGSDPSGLDGAGFAQPPTQTDAWMHAYLKALFNLYNANHNEAVKLSAERIQSLYGGTVYADVPGDSAYKAYTTPSGTRPDIVDVVGDNTYYWEVKPDTPYGITTGLGDLLGYDACMQGIGSRGGPLGSGWSAPMGTTGAFSVYDSGIPGLIFYSKDQRQLMKQAIQIANVVVPSELLIEPGPAE